MDKQFEEHLKKNGVNKKTIKALKRESIRDAATLLLFSDSEISRLCGQHRLGMGVEAQLRHIRDQHKYTLDTPTFRSNRCVFICVQNWSVAGWSLMWTS